MAIRTSPSAALARPRPCGPLPALAGVAPRDHSRSPKDTCSICSSARAPPPTAPAPSRAASPPPRPLPGRGTDRHRTVPAADAHRPARLAAGAPSGPRRVAAAPRRPELPHQRGPHRRRVARRRARRGAGAWCSSARRRCGRSAPRPAARRPPRAWRTPAGSRCAAPAARPRSAAAACSRGPSPGARRTRSAA